MKKKLTIICIVLIIGSLYLTLNKQQETSTFSNIIKISSHICIGKIIDNRNIDKHTKAVNVAVTREFIGDIDETKIELYTNKSFKVGYQYIFFLEKGNDNITEYKVLSVASFIEHDDKPFTIVYDEALKIDVDYQSIDELYELDKYIEEVIPYKNR